jgi:hypothetical protein
MLDTLERDRHMNWTKLRNRQSGWTMRRNAERALSGGALLKIEMKVDGLSKRQTEHQKEAKEYSSSSCRRTFWVSFVQIRHQHFSAVTVSVPNGRNFAGTSGNRAAN